MSFIITNHNYKDYVVASILSCLHQSETDLRSEVIVIDDGSTDGSQAIITAEFAEKIQFYALKNIGLEKAANYAVERANGKYIVRVDADDLLCPIYLKNVRSAILEKRHIIYTNYYEIDTQGQVLSTVELPKFDQNEIISRGDFLATGTLYRKDIFNELGRFDDVQINSGLENFALILKALSSDCRFDHIAAPCFKYRIHDTSLSAVKRHEILAYGEMLFSKYGLGKYGFGKYHPWAGRR